MHVRSGVNLRRPPAAAETGGGDAHLQHAIERELRVGQDRTVVALHLSRLLPPGPRPHHRRIARAICDDVAQSHAGQVFLRANADVMLICDPPGAVRAGDTVDRVFRSDAPVSDALVSMWNLPQDSIALEDYLSRSVAATLPLEEAAAAPGAIGTLQTLVSSGRMTDLTRRQVAVRVAPGGLRPLFRELAFSIAALDERAGAPGAAQADPFLFRYLAGRLDPRMIELLVHGLGRPGTVPPSPALHINMTVRTVLSPGFLRLTEAAEAASATLGIELALIDVAADPLAFGAARMALRAHGCAVVLDGVSYQALMLGALNGLGADLVKLDWAPRLAHLAPREADALTEAIRKTGPAAILLHRAETEAAMAWGRSQGISRFQGRHVDAMLAAGRLAACQFSAACTMRQCMDRAAATGTAGRAGCQDPVKLDSADLAGAIAA